MARGKPFVQRSIRAAYLARAAQRGKSRRGRGVERLSPSAAVLAAIPPQFEPVTRTKPPRLVYPEDRLREVYLARNPASRRLPLDLGARSVPERHVADRFVTLQMNLMEEHGVSEDVAYLKAERMLAQETSALLDISKENLNAPLIEDSVTDARTRLYLASLRDSRRDRRLHEALKNRNTAVDGTPTTSTATVAAAVAK